MSSKPASVSQINTSIKDTQYDCPCCGIIDLKDPQDIEKHKKCYTLRYFCLQCDYDTKRRRNMVRHQKNSPGIFLRRGANHLEYLTTGPLCEREEAGHPREPIDNAKDKKKRRKRRRRRKRRKKKKKKKKKKS
ncbi:hypothetical protein TWF106_010717 [Orbilia oligospora]|uniref:C2H2-type domain-containing protein n=1 Tax=Orbilia oligospora TaxID=2813651 RepID=A0A7C8QIC8_ORBOL|nr:hypothetical protein TWF106_010717 [Orbilia oligospora]